MTGSDGDWYRAISPFGGTSDPTTNSGTDWELAKVNGPTTLNVPSRFATIPLAMTFAHNAFIGQGSILKVQVADGTYSYSGQILLNHPCGSQIQIVGNATNPSACVLNFNQTYGFAIGNGSGINLIDGFTINGGGNSSSLGTAAVITSTAGWAVVGAHVVANNFCYGYRVTYGGLIQFQSGAQATNCYGGFAALFGGNIQADSTISIGCTYGYICSSGSRMTCIRANAANFLSAGYYAVNASYISCLLSTSSGGHGPVYSPALDTTGNNASLNSSS